MVMISSGRLLRRRQQQTGVPDISVENRAISAIVSDAATYGRHRYYAYSYYRCSATTTLAGSDNHLGRWG